MTVDKSIITSQGTVYYRTMFRHHQSVKKNISSTYVSNLLFLQCLHYIFNI